MMYFCSEKNGAVRGILTDKIAMLRLVEDHVVYISDNAICSFQADSSVDTYNSLKRYASLYIGLWQYTLFENTYSAALIDLSKISGIRLFEADITIWISGQPCVITAPKAYTKTAVWREFNKLQQRLDEYFNSRY